MKNRLPTTHGLSRKELQRRVTELASSSSALAELAVLDRMSSFLDTLLQYDKVQNAPAACTICFQHAMVLSLECSAHDLHPQSATCPSAL